MAPKRGLGKGLDSLIPNSVLKPVAPEKLAETAVSNDVKEEKAAEVMVKITKIEPNREQPRKQFNEDSLKELSDSAGERRWRAAKLAGLKEVPVIIRDYTESEKAQIALIENVQREDLNPIEEATAYKRLIEEYGLKQEEVADCVSKSRSAITNSLRLLKLNQEVQNLLMNKEITEFTMGHARALLSVEDEVKQLELAQKIIKDKLSVREVERLVKNLDKPVKEKSVPDAQLKAIYASYEEKIKQSLATKVTISPSLKTKGAGKFEIEFYSNEDFERILEKIMRE